MSRRDVRNSLRQRNRFSNFSLEPLEERRMLTVVLPVTTTSDVISAGGALSLREAIIAANGQSDDVVIELQAGTYSLTIANPIGVVNEDASLTGDLDLTTGYNVVIRNVGVGAATISALGLDDRILDIHGGAVTIEGVTFEDGATPISAIPDDYRSGGAIRTAQSLTVIDSVFSENNAGYGGGAIALVNAGMGAGLSITGSTFSDNSAGRGGAIWVDGGAASEFLGSTFSSNEAGASGGALYLACQNASIIDSDFLSNEADFFYGGAIYNDVGIETEIVGSDFHDNTSAQDGGAIYQADGNLVISESCFEGNSSTAGGAVGGSGDGIEILDSGFWSNTADAGGALHVSKTEVRRSVFKQNTAGLGGAIVAEGYGANSVAIYDSTIESNSAVGTTQTGDVGGGGIYATGDLHVEGTTISGNSTDQSGGGIVSLTLADLVVVNSTISGNTAEKHGGGIYSPTSGTVEISHSTVVLNIARSEDVGASTGGGIYNNSSGATLNHTIVAGNEVGSGSTPNELAGGAAMTGGYNLIGDSGSTGGLSGTGNLSGYNVGDVIDVVLQLNGGPTETHALVSGSEAINGGISPYTGGLTYDQRGVGYPRVSGGQIDIGAFERTATVATGGRHIFYNDSKYDGNSASINASDDNAIATDKVAYLPGDGLAQPANATSYVDGINGIMVDVSEAVGTLSLSDFTFKVGTSNSPSSWVAAPNPTGFSVRAGAGTNGSDRVVITWGPGVGFGEIKNTWLEVILEGDDTLGGNNTNTGLATSDVFFFGNRIGETFTGITSTTPAVFATTSADELEARFNHRIASDQNDPLDFDKSGTVSAADDLIARFNGGLLNRINITIGTPLAMVADESDSVIVSALAMATTEVADLQPPTEFVPSGSQQVVACTSSYVSVAQAELNAIDLVLAIDALDEDTAEFGELVDPILEGLLA